MEDSSNHSSIYFNRLYAVDANLRLAVYTTVHEAPSTIGETFGSETYTVVYTRSCTIQFIIELVGLLLWVSTKSAYKVNNRLHAPIKFN
jgi:hypothetical protein